jgi:hypothetical protein
MKRTPGASLARAITCATRCPPYRNGPEKVPDRATTGAARLLSTGTGVAGNDGAAGLRGQVRIIRPGRSGGSRS